MYVAGARRAEDGTLLTAGGRVLGVTAVADSLKQAIANAYDAAADVTFENAYKRNDIGARAMAAYNNKGE